MRVLHCVVQGTALLVIAVTLAPTLSFAQTFTFPPGAKKGGIAIHSPAPAYPAAARARRAKGVGVYMMRVEIKTGRVKGVGVVRSTGHADLDAAAMRTLSYWRFKPRVGLQPIKDLFPRAKDPLREEDALVQTPVTFR
jgi:TonB family protein